jgi:putative transposase
VKFAFIDAEKASFPISRMCRVLGVSQSGFIAWQDRPACRRPQQDMVYLTHISLHNATPWPHRPLSTGPHLTLDRSVVLPVVRVAGVNR